MRHLGWSIVSGGGSGSGLGLVDGGGDALGTVETWRW